jgi:hypothetical protein
MQHEIENKPVKIDIEKGKFLISLVIGLFAFGEIISLFTGSFNIGRIILGSLLLFLVYEGYDWARILWGIFSAIGAILGVFGIILVLQRSESWGIVLALALLTIAAFVMMSILFFSKDARAFLETRKRQPKYPPVEIQEHPRPLPQYHELSEKVQANFNGELPTYEITTVLPIPNSSDQIILLKYIESFRNVFRCSPDGFVIWQAELPADSNDVYTNIEWKENQLFAFSRSCISVILDVESGKILIPKNAT